MDLRVEIRKEDLGFEPHKVRSLLEKLRPLQTKIARSLTKDDTISVYLLFEKGDIDDLSLTIIWRVLRRCDSLACKTTIYYRQNTRLAFDERHFFDALTGKRSFMLTKTIPVHYETFSPRRPTPTNNQNEYFSKIFTQVTQGILRPGDEFHGEVKTHITECLQNAYDHSESPQANSAGIICSLKDNEYLDFCVADMGQGIKNSFLSNPILHSNFSSLPDTEILRLATQKGVSCNPSNARNPNYSYSNGGIGLYFLKEFVRLHPGSRFGIISGQGYYYHQYGRTGRTAGIARWPGTVVYFRTKLNQQKSQAYNKLIGDFEAEYDTRFI